MAQQGHDNREVGDCYGYVCDDRPLTFIKSFLDQCVIWFLEQKPKEDAKIYDAGNDQVVETD